MTLRPYLRVFVGKKICEGLPTLVGRYVDYLTDS